MKNSISAFLILAGILLCFSCIPADAQQVQNQSVTGFTYTQDKIFIPHAQGSQYANVELFLWGSKWPFPEGAPQEHDNGETIDNHIKQAVADGQQIVLTCSTTAPSIYRASGSVEASDATKERIMPSMEDQYAQRCAETVKRWPQISRVQIGNELKGYWNQQRNFFDIEDYVRLYNKVYTAVKAVRPTLLVGGGYIALNPDNHPAYTKVYNGARADSRSIIGMQYWLQHAVGYDAVCLDGRLDSVEDFGKLTAFFRTLAPGKLIWWSEYYGQDMDMMHAARTAFPQYLKPGEMALWWASNRFLW